MLGPSRLAGWISLLLVGTAAMSIGVESSRSAPALGAGPALARQGGIAQPDLYVSILGQAGGATGAVAVEGDLVFAAVGAQVALVDVSDPADPHEVYRSAVLRDVVADVDVEGDLAYAVHGEQLLILDVSEPAEAQVLSHEWFQPMDDFKRIVVHDGYAYTLMESLSPWAILVIDVRDPALPQQVTPEDVPDYGSGPFRLPTDLAAQGDTIFAAQHDGLAIVDVSDPSQPNRLGYVELAANIYGVDVAGDYAYLAVDSPGTAAVDGLWICDVSDLTRPVSVATIGPPGRGVAVGGSYAYVGLTSGELSVIDVSDPRHPFAVGTVELGGVDDVDAVGGRVLVA